MTKPLFILLSFYLLTTNVSLGQASDSIQHKIDYYISQAKLDSATVYIEKHLDDKKEINVALNYQLVKILFMQSKYRASLKQAFDTLDNIEDEQQRIKFNFMIGCIYSAIEDYNKSVEYFNLVIKHNQEVSLTVKTHLLLSELHLELKDSANAGKSLSIAYKITNNSNNDTKIKRHVAMQYNFFNKNYELCKQQNLEIINDSTSFIHSKSYAYSVIGDCLVKQDSLKEATKYFDSFLELTLETKDPEQIKVAANKLIEVYEKRGNQDKANAYHKIYNEAINDSLSFSVEKYRALYNVEKNRELSIIKTESLKKYLFFSLLIIILIAFGIYYKLTSKQKKREALQAQNIEKKNKIVVNSSEISKIKKAIDFLISNQLFLTPNITRKSFCVDRGIKSERYLSHYINDVYKKSYSTFINDLRIEYAYNRIKNDKIFRNYKIEEIAKEAGFGSKKTFERVFLAKYNESPYKFIFRLKN